MDAQTQDSVCASEKEQLTAPPGWTKKLIPASAKSITLRKHDVVFIAPDGQEIKSKWHLNRYLKAHPEGPALSEFIWSSGEEAPIRRSSRFATKEVSEDNKSTSRKKGKRNASEIDAEETKTDQEKPPAKKRAKKAGKPAGADEKSDVKDVADVPESDEVMHEAIACDNEDPQEGAPCDVQKDESSNENLVDVEASKEALTEKAADEGLDKQVAAEEAIVSSATIEGEHEEAQVKVVDVKELLTDDGLHAHAENELNAAQETGTLVAPSDELKVEEVAVESVNPPEHANDIVMESKEQLDQKLEENMDVSCKVTTETSVVEVHVEGNDKPQKSGENEVVSCEVTMETSVAEVLVEGNDKPLEPLMQKEEQERLTHIQNSPFKVENIKERSPSEFGSSSVSVSVANE